ncbi:MAG: helix-turn-helix domain-containing protein [Ruminococcus sp.]|nr:helix-turn-helix domain-containing protein [Ruminococcus sp.]
MDYGEILKKIRTERNLTQSVVAEYLNISQVTYSHYEIQEKIIPLERLNELTNFFNVSIDYIFSFTNVLNYKNNLKDIDKALSGKRIKELRQENKMTQKKLAEILNTAHQVISRYEKGIYVIATPFLYDICKKYHISADYLLGKIDNPKYLK